MLQQGDNCCRTCLRTECILTPINARDVDFIKFSDKLQSCVSELAQEEIGLSSMICPTCIDHLRIAYDFRNVCLQSDYAIKRYHNDSNNNTNHHFNDILEATTISDDVDFEQTVPTLMELSVFNTIHTYDHVDHNFLNSDNNQTKVDHDGGGDNHDDNEGCATAADKKAKLEAVATVVKDDATDKHVWAAVNGSSSKDCQRSTQTYKCDVCSKEFTNLLLLNDHVSVHKKTNQSAGQTPPPSSSSSSQVSIKCRKCGARFDSRTDLLRHVKVAHISTEVHLCQLCDYKGRSLNTFKKHMQQHAKGQQTPYKCYTCSRYFASAVHLDGHIELHAVDRPFACTQCNYRCASANHLKRHLLTHTGEKPYSCTKCDKKFSSSYSCKRHDRSAHKANNNNSTI